MDRREMIEEKESKNAEQYNANISMEDLTAVASDSKAQSKSNPVPMASGSKAQPMANLVPVAGDSNDNPINEEQRNVPVDVNVDDLPIERSNPIRILKVVKEILQNLNVMVMSDRKFDSWFLIQFVPATNDAAAKLIIRSPFSNFCSIGGLNRHDEDLINESYNAQFAPKKAMDNCEFRDCIRTKRTRNEFLFTVAGAICIGCGHDVCAFKAVVNDDHDTETLWKIVLEIINSGELPIDKPEAIWKRQ